MKTKARESGMRMLDMLDQHCWEGSHKDVVILVMTKGTFCVLSANKEEESSHEWVMSDE